jgi:hypothetical protein
MNRSLVLLSKTLIPVSLILTSCFLQAQLNYRFHWGKIPVAEFGLELPQADSQIIKIEGRTVGFVGAIFSYDGVIQSDYSDIDSVIFQISGIDNDFSEHREINFFTDRPAEILDFLDDEQEQPADEIVESMGITVDPLRVVFALLSGSGAESTTETLSARDRCNGEYSVFDGKRHYRLKLEAAEGETLKADRSWGYTGQAFRCNILVVSLEATSGEEQNPWHEDDRDTRSLWLAEIDEQLRLVRVSMPGPIGRVTGRLEMLKEL